MSALDYMEAVAKITTEVKENQLPQIKKASQEFVKTIDAEGIIHVFGCGHSQILAEEVFYRAGGLAVMNPLFDSGVSLSEGAVRSSKVERKEGYGEIVLSNYNLTEEDLMVVVSNSGRNPVPLEIALAAKEAGLTVIAITSVAYSKASSSRHSSGKRLFEVADLVLDNETPYGDAVLEFGEIKAVPASTISGVLIINSIISETLANLEKTGEELPIFLSGNIDGADERNKKLIDKYGTRINHF